TPLASVVAFFGAVADPDLAPCVGQTRCTHVSRPRPGPCLWHGKQSLAAAFGGQSHRFNSWQQIPAPYRCLAPERGTANVHTAPLQCPQQPPVYIGPGLEPALGYSATTSSAATMAGRWAPPES